MQSPHSSCCVKFLLIYHAIDQIPLLSHKTKMLQGLPVWCLCNQHSEGGGSETYCISPVAFLRPDSLLALASLLAFISCSMISSYAGGYVG